jgi:hypothetical protein
MKKTIAFLVFGCILLTAAYFLAVRAANAPLAATPFPQPTATASIQIPTPSSPGNSITWDNLQVTMLEYEVTKQYTTDFGSTRLPPDGGKFLWVHIGLKNTGQVQMDVPLGEHYSVLYAAAELKPTYGHRQGYTDYTTLGPLIFPDQRQDGWLRFDIPAAAQMNELLFVFLPESSQVGASYSSPNYPYADDKPTYVWDFVP